MQEKVKKKTFMIITIVGIIMLSAVTFVNADNIQTEGEIISHLKDYDVIDLIDEFDNEADLPPIFVPLEMLVYSAFLNS